MTEKQHRDAQDSASDPARQGDSASAGKPAAEGQELLEQMREANEQLVSSAIQSQEAHEAADLRFRELVEGLDAIVWEADAATGQFAFVSQQAQTILGYPPAAGSRSRTFGSP